MNSSTHSVHTALAGMALSLSTVSFGLGQESSSTVNPDESRVGAVAGPLLTDTSTLNKVESAPNVVERSEWLGSLTGISPFEKGIQSDLDQPIQFSTIHFSPNVMRTVLAVNEKTYYLYQFSPRQEGSSTFDARSMASTTASLRVPEGERDTIEARLKNNGFVIYSEAPKAQEAREQKVTELLNRLEKNREERRAADEFEASTKKYLASVIKGVLLIAGLLTITFVGSTIVRAVTWFRTSKGGKPVSESAKNGEETSGVLPERLPFEHTIRGGTSPAVSITLQPKESIVAQSGALLFKKAGVVMELVSGQSQGFSKTPIGLMKRIFIGESFRFQKFTNTSDKSAQVCLSPSQVGTMVHVDLTEFSSGVCADGGAFFACGAGTTLSMDRRGGFKSVMSGLGLFQQRLTGDGHAFLFARGEVIPMDLAQGDVVRVDSGALFMWEPSVTVTLKYLGIFAALTGGEGLFVCELSGQGRVLISTRGAEDDMSANRSSGVFKLLDPIIKYFN